MTQDHQHEREAAHASAQPTAAAHSPSRAQRFWDGRAAAYDRENSQADPTLLGDMARHLRPDDRLLDLGCATGAYTLAAAGHVAAVEGRDLSAKMIAIARQKAAAQAVPNVRFTAGPLAEAGYPDASFDVVLALNLLHLLPDAAGTVRRMAALLKPGGRLISETPCLGQQPSLMVLLVRVLSRIGLVPHVTALSSDDLDALVAGAGLQPTEARLRREEGPSYFLVVTKP